MPFDFIIYSKIKYHYENNIQAFKGVGSKKISFNSNSGEFKVESNFTRTFSFSNKEGTTASSKDGFLYPIAALCHRACHKGLKSKNTKKYEEDLKAIMLGLNNLKKTYGKEKSKNAHIRNVEDAIFTCDVQSKILKSSSEDKKGDFISFCHKEFLRAAEFDFKKFLPQFQDLFNFINTDIDYYDQITGVIINENFKENLKEDDSQIKYLNPMFLEEVSKIGKYLYTKKYSQAEVNAPNKITPKEYQEAMKAVKDAAPYGVSYPIIYWQGCKKPEVVSNTKDIGNFLWFQKSNYKGAIENRIYLNLVPNLDSHKKVLLELLKVISNPNWSSFIGSFKFTHIGSIRNDTVCIYGSDANKMQEFAQGIYDSVNIRPHLRANVANLQKQLFPGVGIGMGAEPGNWKIGKGELQIQRWSYGTHRCFLATWAIIRARRDGINSSDREFNEILIFKMAEIFADNGIDLKDIHSSVAKFENTLVGIRVKNLAESS